jgi:hypothetical protein
MRSDVSPILLHMVRLVVSLFHNRQTTEILSKTITKPRLPSQVLSFLSLGWPDLRTCGSNEMRPVRYSI